MHLSPEFGLTYQIIENDGFKIDARVECFKRYTGGYSQVYRFSVIGFADALERLNLTLW